MEPVPPEQETSSVSLDAAVGLSFDYLRQLATIAMTEVGGLIGLVQFVDGDRRQTGVRVEFRDLGIKGSGSLPARTLNDPGAGIKGGNIGHGLRAYIQHLGNLRASRDASS